VRLSEVNSVRLARQLRATRDRFSVGEVTRTDVAQAQARVARARADLIRAEGDLQNSRANYRNLVGRLPRKLRKPRRFLLIPRKRVEVIRQARRYHPDVITAIYAERAAHAGVDLVRGELLPTLSVEGTMGHNRDSGSPDSSANSASVTARLTVPLYQSGAVMSRMRAAKQAVFRLRHDRAQAYRTVTENATRGWNSYRTASSQVRAFRSEARANGIALEGVRQEARAGLRTVLDVLDAQQELFQSRVDLVRAERDRVVAAYEVWSAMGRLTARQLRLRVKQFDPTKYYRAVKYKFWGFGRSVGKPPTPHKKRR
jgi:outer membrane protein